MFMQEFTFNALQIISLHNVVSSITIFMLVENMKFNERKKSVALDRYLSHYYVISWYRLMFVDEANGMAANEMSFEISARTSCSYQKNFEIWSPHEVTMNIEFFLFKLIHPRFAINQLYFFPNKQSPVTHNKFISRLGKKFRLITCHPKRTFS